MWRINSTKPSVYYTVTETLSPGRTEIITKLFTLNSLDKWIRLAFRLLYKDERESFRVWPISDRKSNIPVRVILNEWNKFLSYPKEAVWIGPHMCVYKMKLLKTVLIRFEIWNLCSVCFTLFIGRSFESPISQSSSAHRTTPLLTSCTSPVSFTWASLSPCTIGSNVPYKKWPDWPLFSHFVDLASQVPVSSGISPLVFTHNLFPNVGNKSLGSIVLTNHNE